MDPKLLIIPLIALGIWVLQYLLRSATENKPTDRPRAPNRDTKPRKTAAEFDRYVNEARPPETRQQPRPPAVRVTKTGRALPVPTPAPLPVLELAPDEVRGSLEKRLTAREALGPRSVSTPLVESTNPNVAPSNRLAATVTPLVNCSATLLELARLLQSPVSVRAAIVLNEVLGPPLARRIAPPGKPL